MPLPAARWASAGTLKHATARLGLVGPLAAPHGNRRAPPGAAAMAHSSAPPAGAASAAGAPLISVEALPPEACGQGPDGARGGGDSGVRLLRLNNTQGAAPRWREGGLLVPKSWRGGPMGHEPDDVSPSPPTPRAPPPQARSTASPSRWQRCLRA
jgi:hypothetical protein